MLKTLTQSRPLLASAVIGLSSFIPVNTLSAQIDLVKESDRKIIEQQSSEISRVVTPLVSPLKRSVVTIFSGNKRVAYGTVFKSGVFTKYSEIAEIPSRSVRVVNASGALVNVSKVEVYKEHDLAILRIKPEDRAGKLRAVSVNLAADTPTGDFLVAAGGKGTPVGFGVVSAPERSLRDTDRGFLGISMDFRSRGAGVLVKQVEPDTAAEKSDLRSGDLLLKINNQMLGGLHETKNILQKLRPGVEISLELQRNGKKITKDVVIGARPKKEMFSPERLETMRRMGGPINKVAEVFPNVIQSDMQVSVDQCGAPVVNSNGDFVGIIAARASRIKTYIIPARVLLELLGEEAPTRIVKKQQLKSEPSPKPVSKAEHEHDLLELMSKYGLSRSSAEQIISRKNAKKQLGIGANKSEIKVSEPDNADITQLRKTVRDQKVQIEQMKAELKWIREQLDLKGR